MARICQKTRYSFAEKKLVLEKLLCSSDYKDISPRAFSQICGVDYSTLWTWGNAIDWDITRIEELRCKTRKKKADYQGGLGEGVAKKILEVKFKHKNWGPLKIKQYLWRIEQILVPQTSIYKFLKENGLVKERKAAKKEVAHDRKFEYATPMAAVQMDLMHLVLSSGLTLYLVTLLDDFSRFVLTSRFISVKTMSEVTDVFKDCIRTHGVMDHLLTDCGSEFVSWQTFTRFEELLSDLDIEYIASGPDKKENQGKVERWHQTVREALRMHGPLDHGSEAHLWIREVVDEYNYERPHQGIGGLLPADRFFGMGEEIEAELERYRADQGLREKQKIYFMCRANGRNLVVSGPRTQELSVRLDGTMIQKPEGTAVKNFQLEKKSADEQPVQIEIVGT